MLNQPNLDRFASGLPDPQTRTPKALARCAQCGRELYHWDECIRYGDDYFCCPECVMASITAETPVQKARCAVCGYEFGPGDDLVIYDRQIFCAPQDNDCLYRYLETMREVLRCYVEEE